MQIININEPGVSSSPENNEITIGIDFGTTNSLIAIAKNHIVEIIPDILGRELVPSIIGTNGAGISVCDDESTLNISSIKRLLGKSKDEVLANSTLRSMFHDSIDQDSQILKLKINDESLTIAEIVSKILYYLKTQAENHLQTEILQAVITVPAYFDDAARGSLILAAKFAGLKVLRLIPEPTAAAYAYGLNKNSKGSYLVYDLGGGTFDVSILNMQTEILQVIAIGGDNLLGGDDIDQVIANYFTENYKCELSRQEITKIARQAKETLTKEMIFKKKLGNTELTLTREYFDQLIFPVIVRTIDITKETIKQANSIALDGIILVGGSTRIPLITKLLEENFSIQIFSDIDPDRAVAWGAALQARNLTSSGSNSLLIDVIPLSIGIELYGGIVEKIILRNSPIPLLVIREFTTYADNQTAVRFQIVQGEREMVEDCRSLGNFELRGIPPMKAGSARVEVSFAIDTDGILSVSALEKSTGIMQSIIIKPSYGLDEQEINNILNKAYQNAAVDHHKRLVQEEIVSAQSLINNLRSAMKEMPNIISAESTSRINELILDLENILTSENIEMIKERTRVLEENIKDFNARRLNEAVSSILAGKNIKRL